MNICNGKTKSGQPCKIKCKAPNVYCRFHKFKEARPEDCPICYDSLANVTTPLSCGHWIHTECIVQSGQTTCPICRFELTLSAETRAEIETVHKRHVADALEDETAELQRELSMEFNNMFTDIVDFVITHQFDGQPPDHFQIIFRPVRQPMQLPSDVDDDDDLAEE